MLRVVRICAIAAVVIGIINRAAVAEVKLVSPFTDNMVLQRGMPIPVWGQASPGEKVVVRLGWDQRSGTAGMDGRWMVQLPLYHAGGPYTLTARGDANTVVCRNVLVGDVWLCGGQSNMEMAVAGADNGESEAAAARYPAIRLMTVGKATSLEPLAAMAGQWQECSPQTARGFSAVGFFFGRELHRTLKVPIGLISDNWSGTPVESWISSPALQAEPSAQALLAGWGAKAQKYAGELRAYQDTVTEMNWQNKVAAIYQDSLLTMPKAPQNPMLGTWAPAALYNGMIAPLAPYGLRGAIWYQGESNAGRAYQYRELFPALIRDWRRAWGQGDFPFLWVQLANFTARLDHPAESDWAELREAQQMTLRLPATGTALAIDIGSATDIHPRNKQEVGRRLALSALAVSYHRHLQYRGPGFTDMRRSNHQITLWFNETAKRLKTSDGGPVKGFAVAGQDHKFAWAKAVIVGKNQVVVTSDQVPQPVAVRYGWANNPDVNLVNSAGLPASPFRTDDWPGITSGVNFIP